MIAFIGRWMGLQLDVLARLCQMRIVGLDERAMPKLVVALSLRGGLFALLIGFTSPAAFAQTPSDPFGRLSSMVTGCNEDVQCIIVDSLPCSCSSGGQAVAIWSRYEELWNHVGNYFKTNPVVCTTMYNCKPGLKAACVSNRCVVK